MRCQFFYILSRFNNLESCGVMMLAYEVEYVLEYIIWISNNLDMKFSQLIKRKTLHDLEGWVLDPSLFQFINLLQLIRKLIMTILLLFTFLKVYTETSKIVNILNSKLTGSIILSFYQNHKSTWGKFTVFAIGVIASWKCLPQAAPIPDQFLFL